jgi:hypothetical protein
MSSAMMMERAGMAMPGLGVAGVGPSAVGTPTGIPAGTNWLMVPRCTLRLEKGQGGLKITCVCDDRTACSMVQNLCTMLAGGMCSCCVLMNGMTVCTCNLTMGMCRCEATENGVTITCTSGDTQCSQMIQACCDCVSTMMDGGCTCCVLMNNTPVCCGTSEAASKSPAKAKAGR